MQRKQHIFLSPVFAVKVGMCAGSDKRQKAYVVVFHIDKQPVGVHMALARALEVAVQWMILVFAFQLLAFLQLLDDVNQVVDV